MIMYNDITATICQIPEVYISLFITRIIERVFYVPFNALLTYIRIETSIGMK